MKNFFLNKKNWIKLAGTLLFVTLFALGASLWQDTNVSESVKEWSQISSHGCKEYTWSLDDMQLEALDRDGANLTAQTEDPEMIMPSLNTYVNDVQVRFGAPLADNTLLQVYWTESDKFALQKSITVYMPAGITEYNLVVKKTAKKLRVDVGNVPGGSYNLGSVSVNSTPEAKALPGNIKQTTFSRVSASMHTMMFANRIMMSLLFALFLCLPVWIEPKKLYEFIFKYRWLIAGVLLVFLVANKYHGDSAVLYDNYVQPGEGSQYVKTVFGQGRAVRSDEWVVDTAKQLSSQWLKHPFGKFNEFIRGTRSLNDTYVFFGTIGSNPLMLAWVVLGIQYGFCFSWWAKIFLTFLLTLEWFLILTKRNKLLSTMGTCLIVFSSFFMWWGLPGFVMSMHGALVCIYYFLHAKTKWKKIAYGLGTTVSAAYFVDNLYPAWQVPVGFLVLIFLIWLVQTNWDKIKSLKVFDWTVFGVCLVLCGGLVASYMLSRSEYTTAIMNTVYPGARISHGGNMVSKLFNYTMAWFLPFREFSNSSEIGSFVSFFPVPLLLGAYTWFKMKKKDFLLTALMIFGIFMTIFNLTGFPVFLAKLTLMSYSPAKRAVDILGYVQVYLLILLLTKYREEWKLSKWVVAVLALGCTIPGIYQWKSQIKEYYSLGLAVFGVILFAVLLYGLLTRLPEKWQARCYIAVIIVCIITGGTVRPLVKGFDCIYSKPAAAAIQKIAKTDAHAKWVAYGDGIQVQSYLMACGVSSINAVNTYPNMELWKKLDPSGQYENVYNRYCHIQFYLTTDQETSFEIIQEDLIKITVNCKDLQATGLKYIYAPSDIVLDNPYFTLKEVYSHSNAHIYEVQYQ